MPPQRASTDAARRPSALAHMPPQRAGTDAATLSWQAHMPPHTARWHRCRHSVLVHLPPQRAGAAGNGEHGSSP